ncbi:MAG: HPr family phosphocarrier protein [Lachnospiraceae bacterium]|nr:HPr family phosphocarrier protein [Lachnospiraceae bacterium]
MTTRTMEVKLESGLEARPVAMLVQVASQYQSKIYFLSENRKINAKSIMGMMGLGLTSGETVDVSAEGDDEVQALDSIQKYLSNEY